MRYFLENDRIKVEIDSFGAEVKSILNKNNMREYMWYGNPKYWGRTSPVLFPFVGSLKEKKYTWQGKEYTMGQHGFARDREFEYLSQEENEIWFQLKSDEETLSKYPFEFVLQIGYRIEAAQETDDVKVMWKVINPSKDSMYFSIGAHPAFLCPVHGFNHEKANCKEGYKLYFEGTDVIHHHGNDIASGLALREDIQLPLENGYATITNDFFDRCTYMIEGNQTKCVGIADEEGKHIVDVCFDTPLFAIWSPEKKNAPFICIEPWYGRCDAVDFEGDLSQREYTNTLNAGETFEGGYTMKFYEYYWNRMIIQDVEYGRICHTFAQESERILGDNFVGVYLHGSAVMGCYNPEKSDLDFMVVVKDTIPDTIKREFMDMVVALNEKGPAKGIEMSIVKREVCKPFVYPTPFELHFSVMHTKWYQDDPTGYVQNMKGTDKDLAAHFTVIGKRGTCLSGAPIDEVFGEVPKADYVDSLWSDIEDAEDDIAENTMYLVLNLARVLAYLKEEKVLSKEEGGLWALEEIEGNETYNVPVEFHFLIKEALKEYHSEEYAYDLELAKEYARFMLAKIKGRM